MGAYVLRRLLLMIPTLFGIMAVSFAVIQFAPGGPVEQVIAEITGQGGGSGDRLSGGGNEFGGQDRGLDGGGEGSSKYRGAQGLDPEFIAQLENSSVSTNRRWNGFSKCSGIIPGSISARVTSAISAFWN